MLLYENKDNLIKFKAEILFRIQNNYQSKKELIIEEINDLEYDGKMSLEGYNRYEDEIYQITFDEENIEGLNLSKFDKDDITYLASAEIELDYYSCGSYEYEEYDVQVAIKILEYKEKKDILSYEEMHHKDINPRWEHLPLKIDISEKAGQFLYIRQVNNEKVRLELATGCFIQKRFLKITKLIEIISEGLYKENTPKD